MLPCLKEWRTFAKSPAAGRKSLNVISSLRRRQALAEVVDWVFLTGANQSLTGLAVMR